MNHNSFEGDLGPDWCGQERGQATIAAESRQIEGLSLTNRRGLWTDSWIWRDSSGQTSRLKNIWARCYKHMSIWCQLGQRWGEGGQARAWLFTPGCLPMTGWGVNNMAWPQISGGQLLHLLHCSAPDSTFKNMHTVIARRPKWLQRTTEWYCHVHINSFGSISPYEDSV